MAADLEAVEGVYTCGEIKDGDTVDKDGASNIGELETTSVVTVLHTSEGSSKQHCLTQEGGDGKET